MSIPAFLEAVRRGRLASSPESDHCARRIAREIDSWEFALLWCHDQMGDQERAGMQELVGRLLDSDKRETVQRILAETFTLD